MSWVEGLVVGVALAVAVYFVVRQFVRPFGATKGTCRSCGEVCVCKESKRTGQ